MPIYQKAYLLRELRQFSGWNEDKYDVNQNSSMNETGQLTDNNADQKLEELQ